MKVLITGGTGTISTGLVSKCVSLGYETYAITRGTHKQNNIKGAEYLYANIYNKDNVLEVIGSMEFDVVIECLAYTVSELESSVELFAPRCTQYIFISSAAVCKRTNNIVDEPELDRNCRWKYVVDKIECEDFLEKHYIEYCKGRGYYTIVRPAVTYGNLRIPFPVATRKPAWTLYDRIVNEKPILACENIKTSAIFIEDFSNIVSGLLLNADAQNEGFNIATEDTQIMWDDVITISSDLLNKKAMIIHVPLRAIKRCFFSIYDELLYDKTRPLLFSGKKLKETGVYKKIEYPLEKGLSSIMPIMKTYYEENGCLIDKEWDVQCDMTIRYSFKKHYLIEPEMELLRNYYKKVDAVTLRRLDAEMQKTIMKNCLRKIYYYLKGILSK